MGIGSRLAKGKISCLGRELRWEVTPSPKLSKSSRLAAQTPYRLHIGPGPNWKKPDNHWLAVDIDPDRGDIAIDFHKFESFPLPDESCTAIYASHTFEHISPYRIAAVVKDCYRILQPGGVIRVIVPNPEVSIRQYLDGNTEFELFKRRRLRAKNRDGIELTLFECLREDFISMSLQPKLLGESLAHQNAWDFEAMKALLTRAGFAPEKVRRSDFQDVGSQDFSFEGTYPSEANEQYRSLYVEAVK